MTVDIDYSVKPNLMVAGRPLSTSLRDVRALSKQMVGHFLDSVVPCGTLPRDAVNGDVTTVTRLCLQLAVSMLDGSRADGRELARLENASAGWAREGIPIDTVLHAIHEGFKVGIRLVVAGGTEKDFDSLVSGVQLVVEMLDTMTSTVATAYVREHRAVSGEHHTAVHTLASALLAGHPTSTMARQCGIEIADRYLILALLVPPHPDERNPALNSSVVARRKLRRLQAKLADRCGGAALSLLSVDGGTMLIPAGLDHNELRELVVELSAAAGVPITAAANDTATVDIPEAVDLAHELVDLVRQTGRPPGLYRFADLALEYQLTRPGPGRQLLAAMLDPLDRHPELLETFSIHVSTNLNRRRSAQQLHVHPNTLDYRLKRIAQLTGVDPANAAGLWQLRAALIARKLEAHPPR